MLPYLSVERDKAPEHTMRQTVKSISRVTIAVTMLVGLTTAVSAAPVLILNPGFEAPVIGDSAAVFSLTDWASFGDAGTFNPHAAAFATGAPEGENVAFASHGSPTINQVLSATAQANTLYTLTDAGRQSPGRGLSAATRPNCGPAAPCWRRTTTRWRLATANS